jgi:hypothetical protein
MMKRQEFGSGEPASPHPTLCHSEPGVKPGEEPASVRVERTLLSAAFDFAFVFDSRPRLPPVPVERLLRFLVALKQKLQIVIKPHQQKKRPRLQAF